MTLLTEGAYPSDWLKREADSLFSREQIVIASGSGVVPSGRLLGKITAGAASYAAVAGNTGNGTIGTITAAAGIIVGVYRLVCIEPATNAGKFAVEDPYGHTVGVATVGVAFSGGGLGFTIADGSTDFASGDAFTITVAAGTGKYVPLNPTLANGADIAAGVLLYGVDATSADQKAVAITRDAIVSHAGLTYDAAIDNSTKRATAHAQLAKLSPPILVREGA